MTTQTHPDYLLHARAAAARAKAQQPISASVATEVARLLAAVDDRLQQQKDVVAAAQDVIAIAEEVTAVAA